MGESSGSSASVVIADRLAAVDTPGHGGKIEPDESDDDDEQGGQDIHRGPPSAGPVVTGYLGLTGYCEEYWLARNLSTGVEWLGDCEHRAQRACFVDSARSGF